MPQGVPLREWATIAPAGRNGHHPIFDRFHRTPPTNDTRYHHNFMGARIAHEFEQDLSEIPSTGDPSLYRNIKSSGRSTLYDERDPTYPHRDTEDYFEWIDLLVAVDRADGKFSMVEVGAGYGRWIANAAAALRRRSRGGIGQQKFIAMEASKRRFDMMVANCMYNEIPAADVELIRAACTPDGRPAFMVVDNDYGASIVRNDRVMTMFDEMKSDEIALRSNDSGETFLVEKIPATRLDLLLREPVDFIDFDIQGEELAVVSGSIDAMDRFVKLAHVATHAPHIDAELPRIFHQHGWRPRWSFRCSSVNETPYGAFRFMDGIQSWENPRFGPVTAKADEQGTGL